MKIQKVEVDPLAQADFVAGVLLDEKFFGDGGPLWERAPTSADAERERDRDIKRLRRAPFAQEYSAAPKIAMLMAACTVFARCGMCRVCKRAIGRAVVDVQAARIADTPSRFQICSMTIIFEGGRIPVGSLSAGAFKRLSSELRAAVAADRSVAWMAAGFDVSLNDDTAKGGEISFEIHVQGIIAVADRSAVSQNLAKRLSLSSTAYRPVVIKPSDGSNASLSYTAKSSFYRRVSFWASKRARPCWNTVHRSLLPRQQIELLMAFADVGAAGCLIFHRVFAGSERGQ